MPRLIIWDFDGTLAHRPGLWSGCLLETLDEHAPGHGIERDQLRVLLRDGFPWHRPEVEHPELCAPGAWWRQVEVLLASAYEGVGIGASRASELALLARRRFIDPSCGWQLFEDTVAVLTELRRHGWQHAILSNHVPELPELVQGLGLADLVDLVMTSAVTGYEKPHATAFRLVLEEFRHPEQVWMVGDNPIADVAGAEALGIPAIQVRTAATGTERHAPDLRGAAEIIRDGRARPRGRPSRGAAPTGPLPGGTA